MVEKTQRDAEEWEAQSMPAEPEDADAKVIFWRLIKEIRLLVWLPMLPIIMATALFFLIPNQQKFHKEEAAAFRDIILALRKSND